MAPARKDEAQEKTSAQFSRIKRMLSWHKNMMFSIKDATFPTPTSTRSCTWPHAAQKVQTSQFHSELCVSSNLRLFTVSELHPSLCKARLLLRSESNKRIHTPEKRLRKLNCSTPVQKTVVSESPRLLHLTRMRIWAGSSGIHFLAHTTSKNFHIFKLRKQQADL